MTGFPMKKMTGVTVIDGLTTSNLACWLIVKFTTQRAGEPGYDRIKLVNVHGE